MYELTVPTSDTDYHYELVSSLYLLISPYLDFMLTNYLGVLFHISSGKLGYNLFETKLKHRFVISLVKNLKDNPKIL